MKYFLKTYSPFHHHTNITPFHLEYNDNKNSLWINPKHSNLYILTYKTARKQQIEIIQNVISSIYAFKISSENLLKWQFFYCNFFCCCCYCYVANFWRPLFLYTKEISFLFYFLKSSLFPIWIWIQYGMIHFTKHRDLQMRWIPIIFLLQNRNQNDICGTRLAEH